jgi:hypothetical protein
MHIDLLYCNDIMQAKLLLIYAPFCLEIIVYLSLKIGYGGSLTGFSYLKGKFGTWGGAFRSVWGNGILLFLGTMLSFALFQRPVVGLTVFTVSLEL